MLTILQSFVLGLESDFGRLCLTMFTAPIVARMCGCPPDKLILGNNIPRSRSWPLSVHNVACSWAMLFMSFYVLYSVPRMVDGIKAAMRQLRNVFISHGLAMGKILFLVSL